MSRRSLPPAKPAIPWPWLDRAGRFSFFRLAVLIALLTPALVLLAMFADGQYTAEPWKETTREIGNQTLHILLISLAMTPLRFIADWPKALTLRRMIGVTAMFYALLHLVLYAGHLAWNFGTLGWEIATRIYLTLGFAVLIGLVVLGWTSTDGWQRRLGPRWKMLHRWVYLLAAGAVLHAFMQSKSRADDAVLMAGCYLWLMGWRLLPGRWRAHPPALAGLAVAAAVAAALAEYGWYAVATRLPAIRILEANLGFDAGIRPAQWILIAGLCVATIPWWRRLTRRVPRPA